MKTKYQMLLNWSKLRSIKNKVILDKAKQIEADKEQTDDITSYTQPIKNLVKKATQKM